MRHSNTRYLENILRFGNAISRDEYEISCVVGEQYCYPDGSECNNVEDLRLEMFIFEFNYDADADQTIIEHLSELRIILSGSYDTTYDMIYQSLSKIAKWMVENDEDIKYFALDTNVLNYYPISYSCSNDDGTSFEGRVQSFAELPKCDAIWIILHSKVDEILSCDIKEVRVTSNVDNSSWFPVIMGQIEDIVMEGSPSTWAIEDYGHIARRSLWIIKSNDHVYKNEHVDLANAEITAFVCEYAGLTFEFSDVIEKIDVISRVRIATRGELVTISERGLNVNMGKPSKGIDQVESPLGIWDPQVRHLLLDI